MPARLRSWFLRNLLEAAERELGPGSLAALVEKAPARVRPHLSLDRLRTTAALDAIPLDEGEEALLALDQGPGETPGRVLERVSREMLTRQLVQATAAVRVGDLFGTVARLRGPLEHPFLDTEVTFLLERQESGFWLTVGIPGRPRATRLLGYLATGAILAAERFARETHVEPLRISSQMFADRVRLEAAFRRTSEAPPAFEPSPTSVRRSSGPRIQPSLSDEVARILDHTLGSNRSRADEDGARRKPSDPTLDPARRRTPSPDSQRTATSGSGERSTLPPPPISPRARPGSVDPSAPTLPGIAIPVPIPPKKGTGE